MIVLNIIIYSVILIIILKNWIILSEYSKPKVCIYDKGEFQKLKILCWNIKLLPSLDSKKDIDHIDKIYKIVNRIDPDIICFQEAFSSITKMKSYLISKFTDYNYIMSPLSFELKKMTCSGLLILSKYKILDYKFQSFMSCGLVDCLSDKSMLAIRVGNTWIINVHLQSGNRFNIQYSQMKQIKRFAERLITDRESVILMGDFNINIKIPKHYNRINRIFGKDNSFLRLVSNNNKDTYCSEILDYIFSNIQKSHFNISVSDSSYPSDHRYMLCNVSSVN